MVPKKSNLFKKATAEELKLSEDLVDDFIDFYWKRVRECMSNLEHDGLQIPNLGIFRVKHWKIDETIEKYNITISKISAGFVGYRIKTDLINRIENLKKIKSAVKEQELKFKKIKDEKKNKDDMEK